MKSNSLVLAICSYVAAVACESIADESPLIRVVSIKQIYSDKNDTKVNTLGRQLQAGSGVACSATPHGQAIACVEQTPNDDIVTYSVSCPAGVTDVEECLTNQKRICYQFNARPCIGGFYCETTNRFSLDCGNLFARSNNNSCSKTDCDVNCAEIRDVPVDYNSVELDNDCFRLGLSSTTAADVVTTEWAHILSNTDEIQVTGTRPSAATVFSTCQVTVRGQAGSSCPCNVNCSPQVNAISYDCTDFSNDSCAAVDCNGDCLMGGFPPPMAAPISPPVNPPVAAPVAPPMTAPVSPPVNPPVAAPVSPPVTPPMAAPVAPPVNPPIAAPVSPPVNGPVSPPVTPPVVAPVSPPMAAPVSPPVTIPTAPVSPPLTAPITPPIFVPVSPPVVSPISPPVSLPVTPPAVVAPGSPPVTPPVVAPPVLSPVSIITSPPGMRPITAPSSNTNTTCPLWWGLY